MERLFRRLKGYRRVFTRYDKLDALYAGFVLFAIIFGALRRTRSWRGLSAEMLWLADGVSEYEQWVVADLNGLSAQDVALARSVLEFSWLADGVSEFEVWGVNGLRGLSEQDVVLAQTVVELSWLADGVSEFEVWGVNGLRGLSEKDVVLAQTVVEFPWLVDGVSEEESWTLFDLRELSEKDRSLARSVAELPWLADAVSEFERWVVFDLGGLAEIDVPLARSVAEYPWLVDAVSENERWTVSDLVWLARSDLALARSVIEMPSVADELSRVGRGIINSMHKLTELGLLDELAQAPWYADGLNDKDLALFSTLGSVRGNSRLLYDALVDSYDAKSRSIFLPLAGEVRLWAFDPIEFREGENPLLQIEDVARVIEAFMGEPFPATDVIMVTSYDTRFGGGAWHAGQYIFVARWGQVPLWAPTVYHEVAHYYFGGGIGPSWLVEGGATFIEALTRDAIGRESLEERRRHARREMERVCHADDLRNIQELNAREARQDTGPHACRYSMGSHFLTMLTLTLGEQTTSSALRDLYLQHRTTGRAATEEQIYRAFLEHTPPELESEFRALYRRLHGGTYDDEAG